MATGVQGEKKVLDTLRAIEAAGKDTKPAMQGIARTVHSRIMVGFRQGKSPAGAKWKPLASRSGQPLRDTRALMGSINPRATQTTATIGTNRAYGRTHQHGAVIKAKNHPFLTFKIGNQWVKTKSVEIPQRKFLPLDDSEQTVLPPAWGQEVEGTVLRHFERATGG